MLNPNQTALAKLFLHEGYQGSSENFLQGLVPTLDCVLAYFGGVVPLAVQCVYNHDSPHGLVQFSQESVPQIVLDGLAVNSQSQTQREFNGAGNGYTIVQLGISNFLGAWAIIALGDPISSAIDGGLVFTNNQVDLLDYLTPELAVARHYVDRGPDPIGAYLAEQGANDLTS